MIQHLSPNPNGRASVADQKCSGHFGLANHQGNLPHSHSLVNETSARLANVGQSLCAAPKAVVVGARPTGHHR